MKINKAMTPRLLAVADCVPLDSKLADIGTDHAYIPIYLALQGKIKSAIAMDVNEGPLTRAEENIMRYGVSDTVTSRLSNGLEKLSAFEVDTVVIAGMGGVLINDILDAGSELHSSTHTFILQPMTAIDETRRYLESHCFAITNEVLAKEGHKLYNIIVAKPGNMKIEKEVYYHIGHKLMESKAEYTKEYIERNINEYNKMIVGLESGSQADKLEKLDYAKKLLFELHELKKECETW